MGAGKSQHQRPANEDDAAEPSVVRIDRSQVPEAYKRVGVSDEVVRRVQSQQSSASQASNEEVTRLANDLARQREENAQLREQMRKLGELQRRAGRPSKDLSLDDMDEKKKVFDETVERVQKQFFGYQKENACAGNEEEILKCLSKNPNKVLNCKPLSSAYEQCITNFRKEVLGGKENAQKS
ncbi:CBN-CHCH-3 protein [Aphelenchoides avenae]|nr:CBN-CHCH-3 protein [Aphelenchus avenae]